MELAPFLRAPRRVAVLGVGAMGQRHVRVFAEMADRYRVVGVFDQNAEVAEAVAKGFGVRAFDDARDCISSTDLVVIASPIEAHATGAAAALDLGRDVLVEKPLCANLSDALSLVRTAARNSSHLFVGHSERFNPVIVALRRILHPSEIRSIAIRRATPALGPTSGVRGPTPSARPGDTKEHDVLLSLGVHDVDLVSYLTRSPISLREVSAISSVDDEDRAALTLVAATGAVTYAMVDRAAPRRERSIEVVTDEELFDGDLLAPSLVRRPRRGGDGSRVPLDHVEPLAAQARAVALTLDQRDQDDPIEVATGADGARALELVLEARRRLQEDRPPEPRISEAS